MIEVLTALLLAFGILTLRKYHAYRASRISAHMQRRMGRSRGWNIQSMKPGLTRGHAIACALLPHRLGWRLAQALHRASDAATSALVAGALGHGKLATMGAVGMVHRFRRPASVTVAASNAPAEVLTSADYICDGTADDVQVQAAIDSGAGIVQLSSGTFNLAASITPASHVWVRGVGMGATRLNLAAARAFTTSNVGGTLNVHLSDFELDGTNQTSHEEGAIKLEYAQGRTVIERLYVHDIDGDAIRVWCGAIAGTTITEHQVVVRDNRVETTRGVTFGKAIGCQGGLINVRGNYAANAVRQGIWCADARGAITDNHCYSNDDIGIFVSYRSRNVVVKGNVIRDGGSEGGIVLGPGSADAVAYIIVEANCVVNTNRGIHTLACSDVLVRGNFVEPSGRYGIGTDSATENPTRISVVGNYVLNAGKGVARGGVNFYSGTDILIDSNFCVDTQGTPTQQNGVRVLTPTDDVRITNNFIQGHTSSAVASTAATAVIYGNRGDAREPTTVPTAYTDVTPPAENTGRQPNTARPTRVYARIGSDNVNGTEQVVRVEIASDSIFTTPHEVGWFRWQGETVSTGGVSSTVMFDVPTSWYYRWIRSAGGTATTMEKVTEGAL